MKKLQEYLDGELDQVTHSAVAGHLGACPSCQGEFSKHQALRSLLAADAATVIAPPDGLLPGIMAGLGARRLRLGGRPWLVAAAFLGPAILAVAGGMLAPWLVGWTIVLVAAAGRSTLPWVDAYRTLLGAGEALALAMMQVAATVSGLAAALVKAALAVIGVVPAPLVVAVAIAVLVVELLLFSLLAGRAATNSERRG